MLNWIRRRLIARRRAIFAYWDGQRLVKDDPMRIFRALLVHPEFDWKTHPQLVDDYDRNPETHRERNITLKAVCDVFQVQSLCPEIPTGLTEDELLQLLWNFSAYCNQKKRMPNPSPTPPESTDSESSKPVAESPTNSCSDCGSTPVESSYAMPPR